LRREDGPPGLRPRRAIGCVPKRPGAAYICVRNCRRRQARGGGVGGMAARYRWGAMAVLLWLAACGTPPIPYDRQAGGEVQTIGLLSPHMLEHATVFVFASIGRSFGLVGALAEAAVQSSREARFKAVLDERQFQALPVFETELAAALSARGYRVVPTVMERPRKNFLDRYDGLPAGPDAWLDCYFVEWGYFASGSGDSTPYRPYLNVTCRLVRARDGAVLMRDRVIYNWFFDREPPVPMVTIPPDPQFGFTTSDDLVGNPERAVQGIVASLRAAAGAIGTLLK
jgi:hypothetical protein